MKIDNSRGGLFVEFILIFVISPLIMALILLPQWMFPALWIWTFFGVGLLALTSNFKWTSLFKSLSKSDIRWTIIFTLLAGIIIAALTLWLVPDRFMSFPREQTAIWIAVILLYPILSVIPQELIFRVLYFERYQNILPKRAMLMTNAALFSYAHLLYQNWVVFLLTFLGGYTFAWAYVNRRNFILTLILHSIGGNLIFTFGMGIYFYSGNL